MARWILIVLLGLATLSFGAASLCGAAFTLTALPDVFKGGVENYAGAALIFSVPSLLIGGGLCWLTIRLLRRVWSSTPAAATEPREASDDPTP